LEKDFADGVKNFHNVDLRDLFKIETGESGEIGWGEIWGQSRMSKVETWPLCFWLGVKARRSIRQWSGSAAFLFLHWAAAAFRSPVSESTSDCLLLLDVKESDARW